MTAIESSCDNLTERLVSSTFSDLLAEIIGEQNSEQNKILATVIDDIDEVKKEIIEIIPVAHHSLASAIHTRKRLLENKPKIIFLEAPEDYEHLIPNLKHCTLPVAFQGILTESKNIDIKFLPIISSSVLSEASAEFQAIKYASEHKDTEIVFVDATCNHRTKWYSELIPKEQDILRIKEISSHTVDLKIGELYPSSEEFLNSLLEKSGMKHFSEWWLEIVENTLLDLSFENYQQIMILIGSVFRRLGNRQEIGILTAKRDEYMWNKIRETLLKTKINPSDAVFICGASHAIKIINGWGTKGKKSKNKPFTDSKWKYGINQSDFLSIDKQFNHLPGITGEVDARWEAIKKEMYKEKPGDYIQLLRKYDIVQHNQLIRWAMNIVKKARSKGYLTSPADSIAIVKITYLLKEIRGRANISKYDLIEAAATCLEKDDPHLPKIEDLVENIIILNKQGRVGYHALPPLAQDVLNRLSGLKVPRDYKRVKRVLFNLAQQPEYKEISNLLWLLKALNVRVVSIVGQKKLGYHENQESWDIYIYKEQNTLLSLAHEGITVEEVFRKRVLKKVDEKSTIIDILTCIRDVLTYLPSDDISLRYLSESLIGRTRDLRFENPLDVYNLTSELLNYFRTLKTGIPHWFKEFIVSAYRSYCQELTSAIDDNSFSTENIATMFSFIFKVESVALSQGATRKELEISFKMINNLDLPIGKKAVVLAAESLLNSEKEFELKKVVATTFWNPYMIQSLSDLLTGLIFSTNFTPNIFSIIVELLDQCFRLLKEDLLHQWMPQLINTFSELKTEYIAKIANDLKRYYKGSANEISKMSLWYDDDYYTQMIQTRGQTTIQKVDEIIAEKLVEEISTNYISKFVTKYNQTLQQFLEFLDLPIDVPSISSAEYSNSIDTLLRNHPKVIEQVKEMMNIDTGFVERSEAKISSKQTKSDSCPTADEGKENPIIPIIEKYDETQKEVIKLGGL